MDDAIRPPTDETERSAQNPTDHRTWLRPVIAIAAIAIIAGSAIGLRSFGRPQHQQGYGPLDTRSPAVNQNAPDFVLAGTDGQPVRLSDLRGKVVLVNFWATWCIPCRQEMPAIAQAYAEHRGQGFTVLEVNEQESPEAIRSFADQVGELPPVVLDRDGAVMRQYHLQGLPDSFLIDRQGIVHALSYGPITEQTIATYIDSTR
jgi:cytochrome c biogenesis protein CcmG, thiol:disulfide interchange protein DsbE